jgi:DNA-binding GntR family transcriptional regulator
VARSGLGKSLAFLLMTIDPHAADWPRQQVARIIREKIASGDYGPKLPSYHKLAEELGVAPMTVQAALSILKDEGLVYGIPGRGTFVREQ